MTRTGLGLALGAAALLLVAPAPEAFADTVTLKNGREIHGRLVEERKQTIRIRTSGGTISISKAEVATFSENENWGDYDLKPETLRKLEEEKKPPEEAGGGEGKPGVKPGGKVDKGGYTAETWKWASGVSKEQQEKLKDVRDELLKELAALGPSAEEREKALVIDSAKLGELKERIKSFAFQRRQGSANLKREAAMQTVVDKFGVSALTQLGKSLAINNSWTKRMSCKAIEGIISADEKNRWYAFHLELPQALLKLLDHQGEIDSPYVRAAASDALAAATGAKVNYPAVTEGGSPLRTSEETKAYREWKERAGALVDKWKVEQKNAAEQRAQVIAKLDEVRQGKEPGKKQDDDSSSPEDDEL